MINRELFTQMGGWAQLFFLFLFLFFGMVIGALITSLIMEIFSSGGVENVMESVSFIKTAQLAGAICMFLLPVVAFAYTFYTEPKSFLKIGNPTQTGMVGLVILLTIVIQPVVQLIAYYNDQMSLPESMVHIENWMRGREDSVERILEFFIADKSVISIAANIFIVAIVAGIVEEFFFRGCLQQIFEKISKNKHVAIWVTAFIFSAIHLQFYGFIPRLLLGALLGYLFVWSRNIWIPVLLHIMHNAINIIIPTIYYGTSEYEDMRHVGIENHAWLGLVSLIVSSALIYFIYKLKLEKARD